MGQSPPLPYGSRRLWQGSVNASNVSVALKRRSTGPSLRVERVSRLAVVHIYVYSHGGGARRRRMIHIAFTGWCADDAAAAATYLPTYLPAPVASECPRCVVLRSASACVASFAEDTRPAVALQVYRGYTGNARAAARR